MKRLILLVLSFLCWQGMVLAEGEATPKYSISGDTLYYEGSIVEWCETPILEESYSVLFIDGEEITDYLVIPDEVDTIVAGAFDNCSSLTSVFLPKSFRNSYANYASIFPHRVSLSFCPDDALNYVGSLEDWCKSPILDVPYSFLYIKGVRIQGDLIIPEGVDTIAAGAFSRCSLLTSVFLPKSLVYMDETAFPEGVAIISCSTCEVSVDGICYSLNKDLKTAEVVCGNNYTSEFLDIPETIVVDDTTYTVTSISMYAFYIDPESAEDSLIIDEIRLPKTILDIHTPFCCLPQQPLPEGNKLELVRCKRIASKTDVKKITISNKSSLKYINRDVGAAIFDRLYLNDKKVDARMVLDEMTRSSSFTSLTVSIDSIWDVRETFEWIYDCNWWSKIEYLITMPGESDSIPNWIYAKIDQDSVKLKLLVYPCSREYNEKKPPLHSSSVRPDLYDFASMYVVNIEQDDKTYAVACDGKYQIELPYNGTLYYNGTMEEWCKSPILDIPYTILNIDGQEITGDLIIPEDVDTIVSGAFNVCSSLTSVTFPKGVKYIGSNTFGVNESVGKLFLYSSLPMDSLSTYFPNVDTVCYLGTINNWSKSPVLDILYSVLFIDGKEIKGDLVIPEGVDSIAENAFSKCTSLTSVTFPQSLSYIGENAFAGCTKIRSVTCYSPYPPEAFANTFANYNGYLYMPCDYFEEYDMHVSWGSFKHVECSSAEETEVDGLQINPDYNHAEFAWPVTQEAEVYSLQITRNEELVCTLNFNEDGQLTNIDFGAASSSRSFSMLSSLKSSSLRSSSLRSTSTGYKFTVTGLQENTNYNFALDAKDNSETLLKHYSGDFKTKGGSETGDVTIAEEVAREKFFTVEEDVLQFNSNVKTAVYDMLGRCLYSCDGAGSFQVPVRGVYLIKTGFECFKIVID
jgi:uncharacterized protein YceK